MSLTGKLGKYQNQVTALSGSNFERYENIFKVYTQPTNGKQFYFFNILNKIELPTNMNSEFFDLFIVPGRMPLTTVSHELYENIHNWWVIYLANREILKHQFYIEGGTQIKYIKPEYLGFIYTEMTNATVFGNRHF